ncbi:MAG: histidine kinase [Coriobacteriia bacterium]|nr:histidine kinase [Coriobacteriia bacterium]MBN2839791.1 histidine kinase [Coriobacteriia bacterium]
MIDAVLLAVTVALAAVAAAGLAGALPEEVTAAVTVTLGFIAVATAAMRLISRPDHVRALQSHQIVVIADRSLAYLRRGLDADTAQEVCRLALAESEAAAVAITDTERVLGFAGLGEDHHEVGGPILTRATREAIEMNEHRILGTKEEIGCPRSACLLKAAIVVPLEIRDKPVGTLKFYYTTPRLLNETQIAMVSGLARLLSTQLELSELERQTELACRMELKALQAQINPHFLFNTINTIAMLIRTDPATARELLREFAAFYRRMLEDNEGLVPLGQEVEYALTYLRFEQARFGDRLRVVDALDPAILDTPVPAFILQPIVENCVQHGIRPDGPLTITLAGIRQDDAIRVQVVDDGVGITPEELPRVLEVGFGTGLGIALGNVHDRLRGHFGPGSGLRVESERGSGTVVTVTIMEPTASGASE